MFVNMDEHIMWTVKSHWPSTPTYPQYPHGQEGKKAKRESWFPIPNTLYPPPMESQASPFAKTPSPLGLLVCRRSSRPRARSQILFPPSSFSCSLLRITIKSPATTSTLTSRKSHILLPLRACHDHGHHHHHHHQHGHHHSHGHGHGHDVELNGAQRAVLRVAKKVGWADLADLLREHLQLCCCSMALLLLAAASPWVLPSHAVRPLQGLLIALAFPIVGVRFNLDFLLELGKIAQ